MNLLSFLLLANCRLLRYISFVTNFSILFYQNFAAHYARYTASLYRGNVNRSILAIGSKHIPRVYIGRSIACICCLQFPQIPEIRNIAINVQHMTTCSAQSL